MAWRNMRMRLIKAADDPTEVQTLLSLYITATTPWRLTASEHAALLDVPQANWQRMKKGTFKGRLSQDKVIRIGFVLKIAEALKNAGWDYQWLLAHNALPKFSGSTPLTVIEKTGIPGMMMVLSILRAGAAK